MALNITDLPVNLISEVGHIGLWLQALGVVIVLTVIFDIIAFILNRRRLQEIDIIKKDMNRIEGKINYLIKKSQKR